MTVTIRTCTSIAASPEKVWAGIEHVESHQEWMLDAERITFRGEQHAGVGAAFDCVTRVGPLRVTDHFVITRWEPGACMGIEHRGAVTGAGEFRLRPLAGGDGAEFCWEESLRFPWWLGSLAGERFARPVLRRIWDGNLRRLKAKIEGQRIASPS
jgi:hypothetical protein